ncbi:sulfatase [Candidatus Gottesmanbacteria bacterium]|nr:sulfatase [Candidatus Gottesmanbacteria bacterium]
MSKSRMVLSSFFVVLFLLFFVALWSRKNNEHSLIRCAKCNVLFISVDTLRADHAGFMGYQKNTTPNIDILASKSFVFTNTRAVSSWTLPSTMSWFTGVYPSRHGVTNKIVFVGNKEASASISLTAPNLTTLAQVFQSQGYNTAAFTGGAGLNHDFGFNKGFQTYKDDVDFAGFSKTGPQTIQWLEKNKNYPFFIFLHGYDVHGQHIPEGGYDKRYVDFLYTGKLTGDKEEQKQLREDGLEKGSVYLTKEDVRFLTALYDEKINRADSFLGEIFSYVKQNNLDQSTVIILTSDHGEEFYEHGRIDHGNTLYDEIIRVPLVIHIPNNMPEKNNVPASGIDLFPTILDAIEIKTQNIENQFNGISLFSDGIKKRKTQFSETQYRYAVDIKSVVKGDKKFIQDEDKQKHELFNLFLDPREQKNVFQSFEKNEDTIDLNNTINQILQ